MTMYEIATVITGLLAVAFGGGALWVKIKYSKIEKEQREQQRHQELMDKEQENLKREIRESMSHTIIKAIQEGLRDYTTKQEFNDFKDMTNTEIIKIYETFDKCHEELLQIQKASLRMELNNFMNEVFDGHPHTREKFSYMANIFDKYQRLGGNSYITGLWPEMKKRLREQWEGEGENK